MPISESTLSRWSHHQAGTAFKQAHVPIREALDAHQGLSNFKYEVLRQGSYKNDSNLGGDSDVDVVVRLSSKLKPRVVALSGEQLQEDGSHRFALERWQAFREQAMRARFGKAVKSGRKSMSGKPGPTLAPCRALQPALLARRTRDALRRLVRLRVPRYLERPALQQLADGAYLDLREVRLPQIGVVVPGADRLRAHAPGRLLQRDEQPHRRLFAFHGAHQTLYDLWKLEKLKRPFPQVLFRNADGIGVHATFACGSVALSLAVQAGLSPEYLRGREISDRASLPVELALSQWLQDWSGVLQPRA